MQLLIILALLLFSGNNGGRNVLEEVKPVLESLGGDEMKQALKSAEELSTVISAVQGMASSGDSSKAVSAFNFNANEKTGGSAVNFPLAPISAIADRDITYSLSRYISQTEGA